MTDLTDDSGPREQADAVRTRRISAHDAEHVPVRQPFGAQTYCGTWQTSTKPSRS